MNWNSMPDERAVLIWKNYLPSKNCPFCFEKFKDGDVCVYYLSQEITDDLTFKIGLAHRACAASAGYAAPPESLVWRRNDAVPVSLPA